MKKIAVAVSVDSPPRQARAIIAQIAMNQGWFTNQPDADEAGERWEKAFLRIARDQSSELAATGRFCGYAFNSSSSDHLQGSSYIEPNDAPELRDEKAKQSHIATCLNEFKQLKPRQFEALCAGILHLLGIEEPKLTPASRDEGIDFYGKLRLNAVLAQRRRLPGFEDQLSVWMIGQAKHFDQIDVSTFDIRDLVGAVQLARARAYSSSVESRYQDLAIRVCDCVYCVFLTTGAMSRDVWNLLKASGVVGMDGEMLATFLLTRGIGIAHDAYSSQSFWSWLADCETSYGA